MSFTELDHALEPCTVIAALAEINITTVESVLRACHFLYKFNTLNLIFYSQLPSEAFEKMMETMNSAGNVSIAPIHVVEEVSRLMFNFFFTEVSLCQKRRAVENALMKISQDEAAVY